jgi:lycopene cyclase domain-containing protein
LIKKWHFIPALIYISWDIFFTAKNVWSFNNNYITGIKLINLPIEEVLFFFVVPYSCVFIYECIRCYFPGVANKKIADSFLQVMAGLLFITGLISYQKYYTSWALTLCSLFIATLYIFKKCFKYFDAGFFLTAYAIILIPFLLVNGFLTALPVVEYNNAENLGIRIYTIPVEDVFYGMLLVLMNVVLFEKLRNGSQQNQ